MRNIHKLMDEKMITAVHALVDYRIETRKAESFQFAQGLINEMGMAKCHAKITVLINDDWAVVVTGSSNMTKNRKIEAGVICTSRQVVQFYRDWIMKEIKGDG